MFSTANFSYLPGSDTLVANASDLSQVAALVNRSMIIKSAVTGKEVKFTFSELERDQEGDITAWVYTQAEPDPSIKIKRVVVYND